jgi:hypothetical protein
MKKLTEQQALDSYDDYLDEVYGSCVIGELEFLPSQIVKELDPTAYIVWFSDWCSNEEIEVE